MKTTLGISFLCFLLISCSTTRQLDIEDLTTEIIQLPFKIEKLDIVDHRDTLLAMNWDVPTIGLKKREWVGNPPLSDTNKWDIEHIIYRSQDNTGVPALIEYRIKEGICKLNSDWNSMEEYAKFRAELYVEIPDRNMSYTFNGELYYDYSASRGSVNHTMELYNQAVKNVTHMILKKLEEEVGM